MNNVAELFAVAGGASRIDVQHHEAARSLDLHFMLESDAVHGVRAAVDFENEGILFRRIEVGRLDNPALDALAVEGIVTQLFDRAQLKLRHQTFVRGGKLLRLRRLAIGGHDDDIAGILGCGAHGRDHQVIGDGESAGSAAA